MILAVALDTAGAAAAAPFARAQGTQGVPDPLRNIMGWSEDLWRKARRVSFPCLLDEHHRVARLYDIVNVPTAVWIDEEGNIVRPPEPAGAYDVVRHIDLHTFQVPGEVAARGREVRARYVEAVRDWVERGRESPYALSREEVERRAAAPSESERLAVAHFQLGAHLYAAGHPEDAKPYFQEAVRLRPKSWTFRRQALAVADPSKIGDFAAGPEYWEAVRALGDEPYYPPLDMPGMPK